MSAPSRPLIRKWPEALVRLSQSVTRYLATLGGEPLPSPCLIVVGSGVRMVEASPAASALTRPLAQGDSLP